MVKIFTVFYYRSGKKWYSMIQAETRERAAEKFKKLHEEKYQIEEIGIMGADGFPHKLSKKEEPSKKKP